VASILDMKKIFSHKDPGTFYINTETGQVLFVNDRINLWRTTVRNNLAQLDRLIRNANFHLFLNVGAD